VTKPDSRAWITLLKHTQLENKAYLPGNEYPDAGGSSFIEGKFQ